MKKKAMANDRVEDRMMRPKPARERKQCGRCHGRGYVADTNPHRDRDSQVTCEPCGGTGWIS